MNLPNLFQSKPTQTDNRLFIALFLTDQVVQAGLWQVQQDEIQVLHTSRLFTFTSSDLDRQLATIDEALQELDEKSEQTDDVIFGFDPEWTTQSGLADDKKEFLETVGKKLVLKPVGFVVITEAIRDYLTAQEPLVSTLSTYLSSAYLHLSWVEQGKLVGEQLVGRSGDLVADLKEALARLIQAVGRSEAKLPPNLWLSSSVSSFIELQEEQQRLIRTQWGEEFTFIQEPEVKILSPQKLVNVVISQGGRAVAQAKGLIGPNQQPEVKTAAPGAVLQAQVTQELPAQPSQPTVAQATQVAKPRETAVTSEVSSFGVAIGPEHTGTGSNVQLPDVPKDEGELAIEQEERRRRLPKVKKKPSKTKKIIIAGIILGLLVLLGLGWYFLKTSYQVLVALKPAQTIVSQDATITLDTEASQSDAAELILSAKTVSRQVEETDSTQTTGVKLVGDPARGKVKIFNKTTEEKTLEEGTILSYQGLEFRLTQEIELPAATIEEKSSGDGETKEYGQIETEIEALEIGAEGNIAEEVELSVANFSGSTYQAETVEAFTGGSSREIRVVSEQDLEIIKKELIQALLKKAEELYEEESVDGTYYIVTNQYRVASQDYSAEVSDEAENLELTMSLEVAGVKYSAEDLRPLAQEILQSSVPEGYKLLDQEVEVLSQPAQAGEEDQLKLEVNLSAPAEAQLDLGAIRHDLTRLNIQQATTQLETRETIRQVEVAYQPGLAAWLFKDLPDDEERIEVRLIE